MQINTEFNLDEIVELPNIAEVLDEKTINTISYNVWKGFEADKESRSAWEKRTEDAMKLALQVAEAKSFPWPGASNVKFPLVTIAALQYHARSYPVLINGETPVHCRTFGDDKDGKKQERADRVSQFMSYQILEQDTNWEAEMDRVLISQPIVGCAFKKSYFDPILKYNVSENILAKDFVVNYWTKHLDTSPRITHVQYFSRNDIYEREARGLFCKMDEIMPAAVPESNLTLAQNKAQGMTAPNSIDDSTPYEILEQHCFIDFDGDGYAEPYIVWMRRDTKQVLRIVARYFTTSIERDASGKILRITPETYFTKFPFIPSPDGGFYDLGFGVLLGPLNQSIDTILNQLIDCGTMANTAGGFLSRGIKLRGGNYNFAPLEWKHVDTTGDDLRKGIVPLPVREPSQVLFTLLNLLINYGERIGGSVDILSGQNPGQNTAAETTRTMAEQGMKIFSGIFKRTYRSLKDEFRKLYRLNQLYLEGIQDYNSDAGSNFIDADDFAGPVSDVRPAADPNIVSDTQRIQQATALLQLATTTPGMNMYEVQKNYLRAMKVSNIDMVLPDPKGPNAIKPGPSEKVQIEMMKQQTKQADAQLQFKTAMMKMMKDVELNQAKIHKLEADAILAMEQAGGVRSGQEIAMLDAQIGAMRAKNEGIQTALRTMMDLEKHMMDTNKPQSEVPQLPTDGGAAPEM
jgi:chaperonin GroES